MTASLGPGVRLVLVRDMVLMASIGVHAHEHAGLQRVRVNVELAVTEAGGGERLDRVVNYETVVRSVRDIVGAGHTVLVETLAERIADSCLGDGRVERARVRVEKLDVFSDVGAVGVEVERLKQSPPAR